MKETIMNFMNSYKEYFCTISEYTILNEEIKKRMKSSREQIQFYSLEIKYKDYSRYNKDIIKYLIANNHHKFLEKEIDNNKINELISSGLMNESTLNYFIDKEHTRLIIKSDKLTNDITSHKNNIRNNIKNISTFELIRKRELTRLQANEKRIKYYNAAKDTKDILVLHYKDKLTARLNEDVIKLEIITTGRTYKKEFYDYIQANNIDIFKYKLLDTKLNNSRDTKLNKEIINKYKSENKREFLYIKVLPGAFKKYKATNKSSS